MALTARKLQRVGNSTGILLPADLLRASGMARDDEVLLLAEEGRIVITRLDPGFDAMVAAADRFVAAHPSAIKKLAE
ncbi:MAG: AbrB/MazE/SpoVT family DNA-binding domain-containing protein [Pseudomonadota bacterium]